MTVRPVSLNQALAAFSDIYSPRIVGRVNDYDIRLAHTRGEHVWHIHDNAHEFFLVLESQFDIALREAGGGRTVSLRGKRSSWYPGVPSISRPRPAAQS